MNVLLIDDDPDDNFLFQEAVAQSGMGMQVTYADNRSNIQQLMGQHHFDLILLDINMPGKTGLDLLVELKGTEDFSKVPVVMYSTSKHMLHDCMQLGAAKYLVKPNNFDDLKKLIERIHNRSWVTTSTSSSDDFVVDFSS